jgi:hypothetical protein
MDQWPTAAGFELSHFIYSNEMTIAIVPVWLLLVFSLFVLFRTARRFQGGSFGLGMQWIGSGMAVLLLLASVMVIFSLFTNLLALRINGFHLVVWILTGLSFTAFFCILIGLWKWAILSRD